MYLINKGSFFHVGIESEDTTLKLPAGLYTVDYDHMKHATVFTQAEEITTPYFDLGHACQQDVEEELRFFFTQPKHRGVLVYGAPGNGKTRMLCELINQSCLQNDAIGLLNPDIDRIDTYVKAVRAEDPDRTIIVFWDEFDDLIEQEEFAVLRFLDGFDSKARVMTVAALNEISEVPKRIYRRPGRFGLVVELEQPTPFIRRKFISNMTNDPDVIAKLVTSTEGMSLDYVREVTERVVVRGHTIEKTFRQLSLNKEFEDETK